MAREGRYEQRTLVGAREAPRSAPVASVNGQPPLPVEALQDLLGGLVRLREELREQGADRVALEQNRLEIGRLHRELAQALIARHRAESRAA